MEKVEKIVGWDEWQPSYIMFLFLEACQFMTSLKSSRLTLSPSSDFHSEPSVRRQFFQIHIQRQYWTIEGEENRKIFRFKNSVNNFASIKNFPNAYSSNIDPWSRFNNFPE